MSQPVRVHLRVPGTTPMPELMTLIESIEAAGFDGAGILDSQMLSRDAFVILGQAATTPRGWSCSPRSRIRSRVTPPCSRARSRRSRRWHRAG